MKILVACEFSGIVRDAFIRKGHDAISCDLIDSESSFGPHYKGNVLDILGNAWDMVIAHPPCTHLAVSGARWNNPTDDAVGKALSFAWKFLSLSHVQKVCVENPISLLSSMRSPTQIVNPYQFGHPEKKRTCLWLHGLPVLKDTNNVMQQMKRLPKEIQNKVHYESPGPNRWKNRSRTYTGIAAAMAEQWG